MVTSEEPLLELLHALRGYAYHFTCTTPTTHERILARKSGERRTLRDIFGWNRSFAPAEIPGELLDCLLRAECLFECDGKMRSKVRVASLGDHLFLHSAFPTTSLDAVFFGPDTYRFARFLAQQLFKLHEPRSIVDMGCGSGAGGIVAASYAPEARLSLVDINDAAINFARVNARFANVEAETLLSDKVPSGCDLVIANPPYLMDFARRVYRDGGALLGGERALDWVAQSLDALVSGGTMLLYTGVAFAGGRSPLLDEIGTLCRSKNAFLEWDEIDPDIFGEELEREEYQSVERIAAMGLVIGAPLKTAPFDDPHDLSE